MSYPVSALTFPLARLAKLLAAYKASWMLVAKADFDVLEV